MDEVVIDFGDASTQVFHVGPSSVAVPGLVAGLAEAHEAHGRLPWAALCEPALELARAGVEMSEAQRFLLEILVPILERTPEGHGIYGAHARAETGAMVPGLERLRDRGRGRRRGAAAGPRGRYRRLPGRRAATARGVLLRACGSSRARRRRVAVASSWRASPRSRSSSALPAAGRPPLAVVLAEGLLAGYGGPTRHTALTGTTHISVIDGDGAAAALSSTLGSGSGVFAGGFQLNNMLGELDVIGTEERAAGERLPSMMAPTLVLDGERAAARARQRGIGAALGGDPADDLPRRRRRPPRRARRSTTRACTTRTASSRWRVAGPEETAQQLRDAGQQVNLWAGRNLYFGGRLGGRAPPDGTLAAAGDPRRGGHGVVVP